MTVHEFLRSSAPAPPSAHEPKILPWASDRTAWQRELAEARYRMALAEGRRKQTAALTYRQWAKRWLDARPRLEVAMFAGGFIAWGFGFGVAFWMWGAR